MSYIELHCHSVFSLLEGASEPEGLLSRAKALGMTGLALTDRDDLGGAVRFAQAAKELGLAGILGTELSLAIDDIPAPIVLLAETREGYGNIASLITRARMDHPRGEPQVSLDTLARHAQGIFALTGGPRGWVPTRVAAGAIDAACEATATLLDIFEGRVAIECWDHHLPEERAIVRQLIPLAKSLGIPWVVTNDVYYAHPTGRIVHDVLLALKHRETLDGMGTRLRPNGEWYLKSASQMRRRWQGEAGGGDEGIRATLAIAERCTFRLEDMRPTLPDFPLPPGVSADEYLERLVEQGAVERWGDGVKGSSESARGRRSAQGKGRSRRDDQSGASEGSGRSGGRDTRGGSEGIESGRSEAVGRGHASHQPVAAREREQGNDAGSNETVAHEKGSGANVAIGGGPPRHQVSVAAGGVPSGIGSLADLPERYGTQIAHELGVICQLGLAGYFLIVWDIVRFAHREGVLCQGRGSAANSAVCYCLGITAIDPIRMDLLFERFLSEDRQEAPDIDIDFAHRDREKVLQYVYERYGREHAAMVCEQITYRGKSAVRDAARVLGFSVEQANVLSTLSDRFSAKSTAEALRIGTTAIEMLGRHYDLDPQSDRPGIPDDARKHPEEWTAEKLLAQRLGQEMVNGTEMSTRTRQDKEAARRVAAAHAGRPEVMRGVVAAPPKRAEAMKGAGPAYSEPSPGTRRGSGVTEPAEAPPSPSPDSVGVLVPGSGKSLGTLGSMPKRPAGEPVSPSGRPDGLTRPAAAASGTDAGTKPTGAGESQPLSRQPGRKHSFTDPHASSGYEERRNPTTALRAPPDAGPGSVLAQAGLDPRDRRVQMLPEIVAGLHQAPRHRSIHVGGFVLTAEPLSTVVPIEPASMPDRTVIQWERDDLEAAGLVKIDLLGLGMLTVLQDCLKYIRATRGVTIDLALLDLTDQAVYDDLCAADTIGVFQVESRAQMNTLPRLKPRSFYDLVVEVALIRPGPIQGEMVHPYLRRRAGTEAVTYPHPSVEPILKRTLGIPLFQEQGMQVAIVAAGFTPGEADHLRRAMGHKRSHERMAAICEKLIAGMLRNGMSEDIARRIYNQINAFADYGFPESHSASFALIVYASAYLRHYYAPEFTAAILNAQPMGFYSVGTLIEDARRHGVTVRPVDLTRSAWDHALELSDGSTIVPYDGVVRVEREERWRRMQDRARGAPPENHDTTSSAAIRHPSIATRTIPSHPASPPSAAAPKPPSAPASTPPSASTRPSAVSPSPSPSPGARTPRPPASRAPIPGAPISDASPSGASSAPTSGASSPPPSTSRAPVVRLGLRTVRGLGAAAREKLEAALRDGPFADIPDVVRRANLDQGALRALCEAGAFDRMVADVPALERRRVALWRVLDAVRGDAGPLAPRRNRQQQPGGNGRHLPPMSRIELTDADYRLTGLSLAGHPMRHLRELLMPNGVRTARDLHQHGRDTERVALAGLVICRQRPGTAKGFVFLSLEDETGIVNVVVTPKRFERQALLISSSPLLLVRGTLQVESKVVNLRGEEFIALRADAGEEWAKGHDFY